MKLLFSMMLASSMFAAETAPADRAKEPACACENKGADCGSKHAEKKCECEKCKQDKAKKKQ